MAMVPEDFDRKQTLVNAERFTTPRLKVLEERILAARETIGELETSLFKQVCAQLAAAADGLMAVARTAAEIDAYSALAETAARHGYVRPVVDDGEAIEIRDGRHPVVERNLGDGRFVPNDTVLDSDDAQIVVLTGPNMAGKSTYLRQVALITLLAQTGSFVPASAARIGVVDRIFTRIGAQDDVARGESTFMVEMLETAAILRGATRRSLILFDEVGRGTSTYDGLAIARAIVEHLHARPERAAKTLFATHYHEMTALAQALPRVRNQSVAVTEQEGSVVFLHRIVDGGADRSYGIHVAELAGMPAPVIERAREVLKTLEDASKDGPPSRRPSAPAPQLSFLDAQPGPSAVEAAPRRGRPRRPHAAAGPHEALRAALEAAKGLTAHEAKISFVTLGVADLARVTPLLRRRPRLACTSAGGRRCRLPRHGHDGPRPLGHRRPQGRRRLRGGTRRLPRHVPRPQRPLEGRSRRRHPAGRRRRRHPRSSPATTPPGAATPATSQTQTATSGRSPGTRSCPTWQQSRPHSVDRSARPSERGTAGPFSRLASSARSAAGRSLRSPSNSQAAYLYRQFASLGTTFVTMFRITSFENMSADSAAYFAKCGVSRWARRPASSL